MKPKKETSKMIRRNRTLCLEIGVFPLVRLKETQFTGPGLSLGPLNKS